MSQPLSYTQRMQEATDCIAEIERSNDIERVMLLHKTASAHILACEAMISRATEQMEACRGCDDAASTVASTICDKKTSTSPE